MACLFGVQVHLTSGPGRIDGVVLDNVVINGRPLLSASDPRIVNEGATGLIVIPPPGYLQLA